MPSILSNKQERERERETAGPLAAPEWPGGSCQEVLLARLRDLASQVSRMVWSHEFFPTPIKCLLLYLSRLCRNGFFHKKQNSGDMMDFLWHLTGARLCLLPSSQPDRTCLDRPVFPSGCSLAFNNSSEAHG